MGVEERERDAGIAINLNLFRYTSKIDRLFHLTSHMRGSQISGGEMLLQIL